MEGLKIGSSIFSMKVGLSKHVDIRRCAHTFSMHTVDTAKTMRVYNTQVQVGGQVILGKSEVDLRGGG